MKKNWNKGNVTLQIRLPIPMAISILGRLYGSGILTKDQYYHKLAQVDMAVAENEKKKEARFNKIMKKNCQKGIIFGLLSKKAYYSQ